MAVARKRLAQADGNSLFRTSIHLDRRQRAEIERLARKENMSRAAMISRLLDRGIDAERQGAAA